MSSGLTPGGLLEIRRVKAIVAGSAGTINPTCFEGPAGPTGATGAAGATGNYGIPASLGYYNSGAPIQTLTSITPAVVNWVNLDIVYSQGTTGLTYSLGRFLNTSATDDILLNVTGFISFASSSLGTRTVYGQITAGNNYAYTQVPAVTSSAPTVIPFSFNIFLENATTAGTTQYFSIYAMQDSGGDLNINTATSRISITRINTSMKGDTGATGPTGVQGYAGNPGTTGATGIGLVATPCTTSCQVINIKSHISTFIYKKLNDLI